MTGLLMLAGIALALSLLLVPVFRNAALRWNLCDAPDAARKTHRLPVPRIGGFPVLLAAVGACLIVAALTTHGGFGSPFAFTIAKTVAPAAVSIFLVGLMDDIFGLQPWQKLAGQILAAAIVVSSGIEIHQAAGFHLPPLLGAVLTVAWLVCCTNAMNLIDGLDGLAAGTALLASVATLAAALVSGDRELAAAIAPLAGALLGFLFFNFNPASIFMGDCGSLVLGFLLGCYGILWSQLPGAETGMTAPIIALSIPLLDTSIAISRRFLRRKPIFGADRAHIHHRLLARGLSTPAVALVLYMAESLAALLALLLFATPAWDAAIIMAFVGAIVVGVNRLGYVEFGAVRRLLLSDGFRHALNGQIAVENLEKSLSEAISPQDCWKAVEAASKDFGFHNIEMQFAGHSFHWRNSGDSGESWGVRIPISEEDWVELSHEFGQAYHSTAVAALAETIREGLVPERFVLAGHASQAVTDVSLVSD